MRAALLVTAAVLLTAPAHAQTRVNDQYQSGNTFAHTNVSVGEAEDVGATSVASGNATTSVSEDSNTTIENSQHTDGSTEAYADVEVWSASGAIAITTASVANGATTTSEDGDVEVNSDQRAHGDTYAVTRFNGGDAGDAATSASASGNTSALSIQNGQARFVESQESTNDTIAVTEADHCCVAGQVVSAAIASANNQSLGGETATILSATRQRSTGDTLARVDLYAGYATDASGNATANGNSTTSDNQWGYVNARIEQRAEGNVEADSYITLGGDFTGFGSAGAYGVGNQAQMSNVGADTVLDTVQSNEGDVSANAALVGEGGGMALASAAAYGNSVTGSLCSTCDENNPVLTASNEQQNGGNVYSNASVVAPRARTVGLTATAIGNAATYQSAGPSN